jgi:hypothetical protein
MFLSLRICRFGDYQADYTKFAGPKTFLRETVRGFVEGVIYGHARRVIG